MTAREISFEYDEEIKEALHNENWLLIRQSLIKAGYPLPAEDSQEILTNDEYVDLFINSSTEQNQVGSFIIIESKLRRRVLDPLIFFLKEIGHQVLTLDERRKVLAPHSYEKPTPSN